MYRLTEAWSGSGQSLHFCVELITLTVHAEDAQERSR